MMPPLELYRYAMRFHLCVHHQPGIGYLVGLRGSRAMMSIGASSAKAPIRLLLLAGAAGLGGVA